MTVSAWLTTLVTWAGLHAESMEQDWVPKQVAIAAGVAGDSHVSITWITDDPRDDNDSCNTVAVAQISGPLGLAKVPTLQVVGTCLRYSLNSAPDLFGNYTSGRIHRVLVQGLVAGSLYQYKLQGDPADGPDRRFRTLPASEERDPSQQDPRFPFTMGVLGDLGQTLHSEETVKQLDADQELQIILHAGDMSYADTNSPRWDSYGMKMEPLASRLQWMVCPGNHEIESDFYTGQNFVAYEARFAMPAVQEAEFSPSPGQVGCKHPFPNVPHTGADCTPSEFTCHYDWGNSFYAFDSGPARVISLNSYAHTDQSSAQYNWLKEELAALERRRANTPWLIIMMHCPFYTSNVAHHKEGQAVLMRDLHGFEELFFQHKAAIVISGHVHAYERSHPVYRNQTKANAPTYIVVGDGGNREGLASSYLQAPDWSAFRDGKSFGHGRIVIANKTHMRWEWHRNSQSDSRRVMELAKDAGSASVGSLPTGTFVDDSVWIINPYKQHHDDPSHRLANASLLTLGIVAGSAAALVAGVLLVQRCRKRSTRSVCSGSELASA
ncbi:unnamed protein product [Effrenium voratum]|nr:unnamed protein product [Effrenium voratum]